MWHFTDTNKLLRYHDNREVVAGETLSVKGDPVLCEHGLHACKNILDACNYAPGPYIWWVELSGKVIHGDDKSVATKRKAVWGYDATNVLREFARTVALEAVEKYWDETKFGAFPEVTRKYLQTGDESLRSAAESAAWSAAGSAARSAARSAAGSAAGSAAWSAAGYVAGSAAQYAAWSAAGSTAWSAAGSAAQYAAWSAAGSTAWSAARGAHEKLLSKMIQAGRPKPPKTKSS